ncbi:MAG: GNAT family N-acetyltransferase [Oscillospiraceae bacterium]|nr:GNAT family N-acetyltransferase [Oscillospiraceae bacterium]
MITVRALRDAAEKQRVVRRILEALPEWFEVEESREDYIAKSPSMQCFCAYDGTEAVGFLCLRETGAATVELAVMGVLKTHHRQGIGAKLVSAAKQAAAAAGYAFMQVKTVRMGMYPDYDATNRFYLSQGFQEFEVLPLWDEANPCQVYVTAL